MDNGDRKQKAKKAMQDGVIDGVNQHRADELQMAYSAEFDSFQGLNVIINNGGFMMQGYDPNLNPDIEEIKSYADKPKAVKLIVLSDPRLKEEHLISGLQCVVNLLKETGVFSLPEKDRIKNVKEREEINRKK
jgi:hypothetical protein